MEWKFYYGDDSTFTSDDGTPEEAPPLNVQAVVQNDPDPHGTGRYVHKEYDYYVFAEGRWIGVDMFGLFDYLMRSGLVKFGRMIPSAEYRKILKKATDDPDFHPKAPSPEHKGL